MLFYEIKVKYARQNGEDQPKTEKETYLVEGLTCADVEKRLLEEIKPQIFGYYELPSCKKVELYDIVASGDGDRWYKAKVEMITVEDSGAEVRKSVPILVQADTIKDALRVLQDYLQTLDCEIVSITRSQIIEVLRAVD